MAYVVEDLIITIYYNTIDNLKLGGIYYMERKIKRGDMFYTDLPVGVGSEQNGYRPILVLSNNIGNKHGNTVI